MAIKSGETTYHQAKRGIVQNGLVLNLDAGVDASYNGGTTWRDLEGGNNGTLTNGPTFSSDNGGSVVFDGTDDYLVGGTLDSSVLGNNPWSVSVWFNSNQVSSRRFAFWLGPGTQSSNQLLAVGHRSSRIEVSHWANDISYGAATLTNGSWVNASATFDGSTVTAYKDGIKIGTRSTTLSIIGGSYYLATLPGNGNYYMDAKISSVSVYNRTLSAAEVLQNYNVTRHRFGV